MMHTNRNSKFSLYVLFLFLFGISENKAAAAVPTWSVNTSNYQYSMTFISVLNIQGYESHNANDMVGAFVNGECRGVAKPASFQASTGRYLAYLMVSSNVTTGEKVSFKIYDSKKDTVYTVPNTVDFSSDVSKGVASDPYVFYTDNIPSDLMLDNKSIEESKLIGTQVGAFTTVDSDNSGGFVYTLVPGVGDTNNASFKIEQNLLKTNAVFDYKTRSHYSILVKTTDAGGAFLIRQFTISVVKINKSPIIAKQNFTVNENSVAGTKVGIVKATDPYGNTMVFALRPNVDSSFVINAATGELSVFNPLKLDFEKTPVFSYYIVVTNNGTPAKSDSAIVVISLKDVNEAPVLKDGEFKISEKAATETFIGKAIASDQDANSVLSFRILNTSPVFDSLTQPFFINKATGDITVLNTKHLDFEANPVITLTVVVEDQFHLKGTALIKVKLTDELEPTVKAFNLFTPNGDGFNDLWEIENPVLYNDFTLTIFNSAGEIIVQRTGYQNDWDGTYRGKAVPEGTYFYDLRSKVNPQIYKGALTLMR
jgi:gliding motility-associated-like protein